MRGWGPAELGHLHPPRGHAGSWLTGRGVGQVVLGGDVARL